MYVCMYACMYVHVLVTHDSSNSTALVLFTNSSKTDNDPGFTKLRIAMRA
jgi:hypothetical protein